MVLSSEAFVKKNYIFDGNFAGNRKYCLKSKSDRQSSCAEMFSLACVYRSREQLYCRCAGAKKTQGLTITKGATEMTKRAKNEPRSALTQVVSIANSP